ncbi:MAG: extracellular solute-binding protein [Bdellovibrionota bacterium]
MKLILARTAFLVILAVTSACTRCDSKKENKDAVDDDKEISNKNSELYKIYDLPKNIVWESNDEEPVYASEQAKKGGTFHSFLSSFPLTLRNVGPDSNGSFRSVINDNQLGLVEIHPNTDNVIPELAEEWAYDPDGVTVYYKLNPKARWSDGKPITADDFIFQWEFMRSKHIVAPWYNDHYSKEILSVKKYGDHILSITGHLKKPKNDLHYYYGMSPRPRHFHKLDENWVKNYNWKVEPNSGPYQISEVKKGKLIILKRKKDWWAKDLRYFKNRFNVDRIEYRVIRDLNVAWEHFKRAELDAFSLTLPDYWHDKSKIDVFTKGYTHKVWFFVDQPQPDYGMWLNQAVDIFKDRNVRLAFAHAMNFEKVLKEVLRGDYFRLQTGTTGYGKYTNTEIRAREFSIKKVTQLMTSSGWKRGADGIWIKGKQRYAVRVTYGAPHHTERLVVLKEEAKKAGIELELQLLDANASFKSMLEKQHQVAWTGWGPQYRPQYWGQYHSENANKPQTNNFSNTASKEIDSLIDQYKNELDEETRYGLARKIQAAIAYEGAYIPTFLVPYFRQGYWRWWKFPKVAATKMSESLFDLFGSTGGLFWLDQDTKEETLGAMKAGKSFAPVTITDKTYKIY